MISPYPYITAIQSTHMSDLSNNTMVFNLKDFSDTVCIKLPDDFPRHFNLNEMYYLNDDKIIEFEDYVTRDEYHPWIDIKKNILDTSIGNHIYRLSFTEPDCTFAFSCWFGYIIQENNPEQPYVYMNRTDDSSSDDSSEE